MNWHRKQRSLKTNNIELRVVVEGKGPLLILLHGFPSLGYMWKDLLSPFKEAGYRVAIPDQRGYGRSSKPDRIDAYSFLELTADVVGIADACGEEKFHLVGHDFGCVIAWYTALNFPHRLYSVTGISVPFSPIGPQSINPPGLDEVFWYMRYFQNPGLAEAELEADVERSFGFFKGDRSKIKPRAQGRDGSLWPSPDIAPPSRMASISEDDFNFYVKAYEKSGFRSPLNWYRNMASVPTDMPWLKGAKIRPPAHFIAGSMDPVLKFFGDAYEKQAEQFVDFKGETIIEGGDHWVVESNPDAVFKSIIGFHKAI